MKAIVMPQPGEPDVLQLQDLPQPEIQHPTDLLVRLEAAGVNPIDTKLRRRGTFYPERMPAILGCDGAGVVVAVGSGVQRFRIGDAVYFCQGGLGGQPGNYAEFTVVDERFVAAKPRSLSFVEAAAVPLVLITAWESLYDRGQLQAGEKVLIHAGAGGVGHIALQLAKLRGATVCTTVGSPEKADLARNLGADETIFYKHTDFVAAALAWSGGTGVDLTFDTIGGPTFSRSFAATRVYGTVVTILEPDPATEWKTARTRNLRTGFDLMLTPMLMGLVEHQQRQAQILEQGAQWFDQGQLQVQVSQTLNLEEAAIAHRLLESGSTTGKIVLSITG